MFNNLTIALVWFCTYLYKDSNQLEIYLCVFKQVFIYTPQQISQEYVWITQVKVYSNKTICLLQITVV